MEGYVKAELKFMKGFGAVRISETYYEQITRIVGMESVYIKRKIEDNQGTNLIEFRKATPSYREDELFPEMFEYYERKR